MRLSDFPPHVLLELVLVMALGVYVWRLWKDDGGDGGGPP